MKFRYKIVLLSEIERFLQVLNTYSPKMCLLKQTIT